MFKHCVKYFLPDNPQKVYKTKNHLLMVVISTSERLTGFYSVEMYSITSCSDRLKWIPVGTVFLYCWVI